MTNNSLKLYCIVNRTVLSKMGATISNNKDIGR